MPSYEQLFQDMEKPAGHSAEIAVHGKTELQKNCQLAVIYRCVPHLYGFQTVTLTVPSVEISWSLPMEVLRFKDFILCSSLLITFFKQTMKSTSCNFIAGWKLLRFNNRNTSTEGRNVGIHISAFSSFLFVLRVP